MLSIMPGSEPAPAWGRPDPIHLLSPARKVLLAQRGSRSSGEEGEMEGNHAHRHLCKRGQAGTTPACRQKKRKRRWSEGRNGRFLPGTKPVNEKGAFSPKPFFFCQHAGGTSFLLLVQVFSESYGSHNRFQLVALPVPLLFSLKCPPCSAFHSSRLQL